MQPGTFFDKHWFPTNSPILPGTASPKEIAWKWGIKQGIQTKKIKSSSAFIKNTSGSLSFDKMGVVSTQNFNNASLFNAAVGPISTHGTPPVDVPGAALGTLILPRPTRILYFVMGIAYVDSLFKDVSSADQVDIGFHDTTTGNLFVNVLPYGLPVTIASNSDQWWYPQMLARTAIRTETAGTHVYNLYYGVDGTNGGTASLFAYEFGYMLLGQ